MISGLLRIARVGSFSRRSRVWAPVWKLHHTSIGDNCISEATEANLSLCKRTDLVLQTLKCKNRRTSRKRFLTTLSGKNDTPLLISEAVQRNILPSICFPHIKQCYKARSSKHDTLQYFITKYFLSFHISTVLCKGDCDFPIVIERHPKANLIFVGFAGIDPIVLSARCV